MASHPLTASERRGILIIAGLALLITGAGLCVSRCGRPSPTSVGPDPKVEVVYESTRRQDSLAKARKDSIAKLRKDSLKNARKRNSKAKREPKVYRRRSPIDEGV